MTFNIIYQDMEVCISNRPTGTLLHPCATFVCVCVCASVKETKIHHANSTHAYLCLCRRARTFFGACMCNNVQDAMFFSFVMDEIDKLCQQFSAVFYISGEEVDLMMSVYNRVATELLDNCWQQLLVGADTNLFISIGCGEECRRRCLVSVVCDCSVSQRLCLLCQSLHLICCYAFVVTCLTATVAEPLNVSERAVNNSIHFIQSTVGGNIFPVPLIPGLYIVLYYIYTSASYMYIIFFFLV